MLKVPRSIFPHI